MKMYLQSIHAQVRVQIETRIQRVDGIIEAVKAVLILDFLMGYCRDPWRPAALILTFMLLHLRFLDGIFESLSTIGVSCRGFKGLKSASSDAKVVTIKLVFSALDNKFG